MRKIILAVFLVITAACPAEAEDLEWLDISRGNTRILCAIVEPDNPRILYFGSHKGVFKSEDAGASWRNILSVRGDNTSVNFLTDSGSKYLYAATGNGLYVSADRAGRWRRIYRGKSTRDSECTAVLVDGENILLGTKGGLFISNDSGRTFRREASKLGNSRVFAISQDKEELNNIYVACVNGLFKSADRGKSWARVFAVEAVENGDEQESESEDNDKEERYSEIRCIVNGPKGKGDLYLATVNGIKVSRDNGSGWETFSDFGLLSKEVIQLVFSKTNELYALTGSGVFKYTGDRWQELSFGLAASKVNYIYVDSLGIIYAACEEGLFMAKSKINSAGYIPTSVNNSGEPDIKAVQKAAIKYAEVDPEKIIRWRRQAARRAFLPQFSAGISRNTTDLWHWESGSTTKSEDDTLRKGQDSLNWDIKLSWNLGELIWNEDQTSIDVRSRLMVQLRDDILDEVNKLYFERLRVKNEIASLTIEERKKRSEKELRLDELTASIDALTGGFFSRNLNSRVS